MTSMSQGITLIRLTTVHPALVHFALGTLPLLVLAYGVAVARRSERWGFVGDVTAIVTALVSIIVASFGLVSNWVLDWPGGIGFWRWLHLAFGLGSTLLLVTLAGVRLQQRRQQPIPTVRMFWATAGIGATMLFAGWIGGEVLVFRSGMAVTAAGDGALAPTATSSGEPHDVMSAMVRIRPAWARAGATLARAVVGQPEAADYAAIADEARQIGASARWLEAHGETPEPSEQPRLRSLSGELAARSSELEQAASARHLADAAQAWGNVTGACSRCHAELRWTSAQRSAER